MKTNTHGCKRCEKPVNDNHLLCRVCRSSRIGGNHDDDPPGPGIGPKSSDGMQILSPAHRNDELVVIA